MSLAALIFAAAISLPAIVSEDMLEPSVLNEVEHALDRIPDPDAPFDVASVDLLRDCATNGLSVTDNAIALVSAQRADGRWFVGGADATAGAMFVLRELSGSNVSVTDAATVSNVSAPGVAHGVATGAESATAGQGGSGSSALRALQRDWAAETAAPLPQSRAEWEDWRKGGDGGFAAMVERAKKMRPQLAVERRDPADARKDCAAVVIGGSGQSLRSIWELQGRYFCEAGFTVLMVENPPDDIARICLERGTSWLAYGTAALLPRVAELRKEFPRIVWSGFSLGTELMMSTARFAALEDAAGKNDVFVYNDFLCRNKERLIVFDGEPNSLRYVTPGYFNERDFPERMLALSDHKMIFTEGGLDRDFDIVRSIFPENVEAHHQPKFAAGWRYRGAALPPHLTRAAFFRLCNVDPANHNFKWGLIEPWLRKVCPR